MAVIDDIIANVATNPGLDVVGNIITAIDEYNALPPQSRAPTLGMHLGLNPTEFTTWQGPSTRVVNRVTRTTLGNALALQTIILARING